MKKKIFLLFLSMLSLSVAAQDTKPIVNIYVDNTGSMFGYISEGNEFEWAISNLITSINLSELTPTDSIHLFYINSSIFPYKGSTAAFLKGVKVHNAQTYKGDLGKTCMSNFFSKVLERTGGDTISIIISDFIISPGKGNDATTVLASEKNAISNVVKSKLNSQRDLSMAMYRMMSTFKGQFYNCTDVPKWINAERPYYMWIISSKSLVSEFRHKIPYKSIDSGLGESAVTNSYVFFNANAPKTPKYMAMAPSSGSLIPGAKGITKAKLGRDGKFRFIVAVDLSQYLLLGKYLTATSSYSLNNKQYKVVKVESITGKGTTHRVYIETTQKPTPSTLTLTLTNQMPTWVGQYNIDPIDCGKIFDAANLDKTFGIKTIADAVFQAFYYNKSDLLKVNITINQKTK